MRYWRKRCPGLRAAQLGPMVQVSPDAISKIEKGQYKCPRDLAERLDAVLETGGVLTRAWGMVFGDAETTPTSCPRLAARAVEPLTPC
nr:helix-turn-helix transcriptional regulator [Streptomyces caeruleatus]